eukprot:6212215-Pleurochrysis_carterae.AAC.2
MARVLRTWLKQAAYSMLSSFTFSVQAFNYISGNIIGCMNSDDKSLKLLFKRGSRQYAVGVACPASHHGGAARRRAARASISQFHIKNGLTKQHTKQARNTQRTQHRQNTAKGG